MHVLIALAVLGITGDPALGGFEGWTPPEPDLPAGEVRIIGSYPARLFKEAGGTREYYDLQNPPQITLAARGPATVALKVIGHEPGVVTISLDLNASRITQVAVRVSPQRPAELFFQVPEGQHLVAVSISSRILLSPRTTDRPPPPDRLISWGTREKGDAGSSFWKYQPDLTGFEHQEDAPPRRWSFWVNAGLGPSVNMDSSTSGLALGGSANFRIDHYLVQLRSTYNMEMSVLGPEPHESFWEVSPMFGFVLKGKVGWISAAAGVGLAGGVNRGKLLEQGEGAAPDKYAENDFINVGFPIDVQLFLKPPSFSIFGLGLNIYANLGPDNSIVGLMVSIMAGI